MTNSSNSTTDAQPDDKVQQLEQRVAELESMTEIGDEEGDGWSMGDLLDLGLTRRQALTALALLGAGYALGPAIAKALSEPAAASHGGASLGTSANPLKEIYVHDLYNTTDNIVADSVSTDELNNVVYASENDSNLPGIQSAINSVSQNGQVVIVPGEHDLTGQGTLTIDKRIGLHFFGTVLKDPAADPGVQFTPNAVRTMIYSAVLPCVGSADQSNDAGVGVEFNCQFFAQSGTFSVFNAGSHGIHLHQSQAGDNLNKTEASLQANFSGGDGIRIENNAGQLPNINACNLVLQSNSNDGNGVNILAGQANVVLVKDVSYNGDHGIKVGVGDSMDRWHIRLLFCEGNDNNGNGVDGVNLTSDFQSSLFDFCRINDGITQNEPQNTVVRQISKTRLQEGEWTGVSSSRTAGTWYQNTNNYPLEVWASGTAGSAGERVYLIAHTNSNEANNRVDESASQAADSSNAETVAASVHSLVPPGYYYKIQEVAGTADTWKERVHQ